MRINIVLTAYNRPEYLAETLASWKNVRGIEARNIDIFLEPSPVKYEMERVAWDSGLNVVIHHNPVKHGVLHNPWEALEWSFTNQLFPADFTILAEEDVVVSSDVLEYFDLACSMYGPEGALGVCSYTANLGDDMFHVKLAESFEVLTWGTWSESWFSHIRDTWDHDYSTNSGTPGQNAGWDHNLNRLSRTVKPFVHPDVSRCKHIGRNGGVHMTADWFDTISCPTFQLDR